MKFHYKARTFQGKSDTGIIDASKKEAALEILQRSNLVVTSIESLEEQRGGLKKEIRILPQKVSAQDLVFFFRQLSILVGSDVPLVESLETLSSQTKNQLLASQLSQISAYVDGGMSFSDALVRFPRTFSNFDINMIKTGEVAGNLRKILEHLADHTERSYTLTSEVKGAMTYPAFIFGGIIIVAIIMLTFVMPKMFQMFNEFGAELPLPTKILMGVSNFFAQNFLIIFILTVAIVFSLLRFIKTPKGRRIKDKIEIKVPILGKILQQIYISRVTENLGTLIKGGIPIVQALDTVALVIGNSLYEDVLKKARDNVRKGETVADAFKDAQVIPVTLTQMIASGEKSGKLEKVLAELTKFYNNEVSRAVDNLMTLIEPVILVVMGVAVAFMAAAVILPIYNLAGSIM
ncbi:MAG: type II secretion system F family protein [Patescibacteria group bacterium]